MNSRSDSADFIRSARERLELTQRAFAELLAVSLRTVKRYEAGGNVPASIRNALAIVLKNRGKKS